MAAVGRADREVAPTWARLEQRLRTCTPESAAVHGLGVLSARARRQAGLPVPEPLAQEEQWAAVTMLLTKPVLERVRAACDGPLVLMKGAEVAARYPAAARSFSDVDLLVPDARSIHKQLKGEGFIEIGDPELFYRIHHLRPLQWPDLPLAIEIHSAPKWPERLPVPPVSEIVDGAVPSILGAEGILAPSPEHHALLIAGHAWAHEPLWRLRDLVDVRAAAASADPAAIELTARRWRALRLWRTTDSAASALLDDGRHTVALRVWAQHLVGLRERTVLENHLQAWLSGYWALPPRAALASTAEALLDDVRPAPEEGWRDKIARARKASRNAAMPRSAHDLLLGDAATRGQGRNLPDEDE